MPATATVPNPQAAQTKSASWSTMRRVFEVIIGQARDSRFLGMLPLVRSRSTGAPLPRLRPRALQTREPDRAAAPGAPGPAVAVGLPRWTGSSPKRAPPQVEDGLADRPGPPTVLHRMDSGGLAGTETTRGQEAAWGWLASAFSRYLSMGARTILPHSVHEPS